MKEGETAHVVGLIGSNPYFHDVYISDISVQRMKTSRGVENQKLIFSTPQIPIMCVGGPLLN